MAYRTSPSRTVQPVKKRSIVGLGIAGIVTVLFGIAVNLLFWLGLIFGTLWGLDHFGVLDKF